jgi:hypothetical protein
VRIFAYRKPSPTQRVVPLTGATIVISAPDTTLIISPAGTLDELTVTFPSAGLVDGSRVSLVSQQAVTALTLNGGTINNGVTSLSAAVGRTFVYAESTAAWYRLH